MLERIWRKENPYILLVGIQIGAAIIENNMELPQQIQRKNYHKIYNFTSENVLKGKGNTNLKKYLHPYTHCRIIYNSKEAI